MMTMRTTTAAALRLSAALLLMLLMLMMLMGSPAFAVKAPPRTQCREQFREVSAARARDAVL